MCLVPLSLMLCFGQVQPETLPPDLDLLSRVKIRMAENLSRLPNYTCLQTIERSRRRADGRKFEPLDRVRLEVALVEGKEVFGWPGGDKIAESEITNLVSGTIGNGDFALFLKSIFLGSGATFRYAGETTLEGKRAIRFDYVVPLLTSGYHLRVPPREALVPYHGSFWLEPESLDLLRLELVVDAIPPYLGVAAASDAMDYGRAEIGGLSFLLPRQSELDMTDLNGRENRNRTRFTACRQFTGESTLSFGDVLASAPEAAAGGTKNAELPKEFEGDFRLETPIDPASSAVGDLIRGKLLGEIKTGRQVLVPKGAELRGRITRLERSEDRYFLDLVATSIDFGGARYDLAGRDNSISFQISTKALRAVLGSYTVDAPFTTTPVPATIPGGAFQLPAGSRMTLRSRLLQSEK